MPTYSTEEISTALDSSINSYLVKKYTEKTDKHVDELEEDIEFLNQERGLHLEWINTLMKRVNDLEKKVADLECNLHAEVATI